MKHFLLLAILLTATTAFGQGFKVGGIVYNVPRTGGVARVQLTFSIAPNTPQTACTIPAPTLTDRSGTWSQTGFTKGCTYIVKPYKPFYQFRLAQLLFSTPGTSLRFYQVE